VAKVQTIIQFDEKKVTKLPNQDKKMIGHYLFKDHSIPLLDLRTVLRHPENKNKELRKIIIVLQFNNTTVSVLFDGINTIHRLSVP
jgi:chemotaxis signal transduction protein